MFEKKITKKTWRCNILKLPWRPHNRFSVRSWSCPLSHRPGLGRGNLSIRSKKLRIKFSSGLWPLRCRPIAIGNNCFQTLYRTSGYVENSWRRARRGAVLRPDDSKTIKSAWNGDKYKNKSQNKFGGYHKEYSLWNLSAKVLTRNRWVGKKCSSFFSGSNGFWPSIAINFIALDRAWVCTEIFGLLEITTRSLLQKSS